MRVMDAVIMIAALAVVWVCYKAQKNPNFQFDIFDLVMHEGKLSKTSVAFMVTLIVTSWVLIRATLDGKLTDTFFIAYGTMWVAPLLTKMFAPGGEGSERAGPARRDLSASTDEARKSATDTSGKSTS